MLPFLLQLRLVSAADEVEYKRIEVCGVMKGRSLCSSDGSNHIAAVIGYESDSCTAWCDQLAKVRHA